MSTHSENKMSYVLAHHAHNLDRYQAAYALSSDKAWFKAMLEEAREIRKVLDVYEQDLALEEQAEQYAASMEME